MAMTIEQKVARLKLVADGLRRIQEFESARYLDEYAAHLAQPAQACLPWISVAAQRPERNKPAIYWHKSEFGGFAAIADEWRDEHHLAYATHWLPYTPPTDGEG